MQPHLLTPSQASEVLAVSTRTLRRWSIAFKDSLSDTARRRGQKRFYSSQDIDTLRRAQRLLNEGLTIEEAAERIPAITPEEKTTALTLSPEQNLALGQALERTARLTDTIKDHDSRLEKLEAWLKLPWWKRIFSKPPN